MVADEIPDLIRRMRRRKVFVAHGEDGLLVCAVPTDDGQSFKSFRRCSRTVQGSRRPTRSAPKSKRRSAAVDYRRKTSASNWDG